MASVTRSSAPTPFRTPLTPEPARRPTAVTWTPLVGYGAAVLACLGVFVAVFAPQRCDLRVPFCYRSDALAQVALIKGMLENGWYLENPRLGAPFQLELYDYPMADGIHWAWLKLFGCFCTEPGLVFNLYYLVSFPLTTILALAVLRRFSVSFPVGIVAALLYTFLPWHFLRVEHLFLACYYLVPPTIMVALEVYLGLLPRPGLNGGTMRTATVCLLVGAAGIYYAFFACLLLIVAGLARFVQCRLWRSLCMPGVMVVLVGGSVLAGFLPNLIYQRQHGRNREIVRFAAEAERFGLRLTQLLLPARHHRLAPLAHLTEQYSRCLDDLCNENATVSLGLIAGIGFVGVVGVALFGRRRPRSTLHAVGVLALAAFLIGTVSGGGALFNLFIPPYIRCYNRIAVFIAFLSLFAVAVFLEKLRQRGAEKPGFAWKFHALLVVLATVGILDQTRSPSWAERDLWQAQFDSDAEFVGEIESRLPPASMIYQMPNVSFPEAGRIEKIVDYDLLRPYLHSRRLHWSYGAMKGRAADAWHQHLAREPLAEQVKDLLRAGFAGITIDRFGYADNGAALEVELSARLGAPPLVSRCERFAFFELGR